MLFVYLRRNCLSLISYLLKFDKSENFLKQAGSRGNTPGCFNAITGLCYEEGLVDVCNFTYRRIFD